MRSSLHFNPSLLSLTLTRSHTHIHTAQYYFAQEENHSITDMEKKGRWKRRTRIRIGDETNGSNIRRRSGCNIVQYKTHYRNPTERWNAEQ